MVRFAPFLANREPTEALLREYVRTRGEWRALEFKEARGDPVFGLRRTVAAFANQEGGDLFLGIRDDGDIVGTPVGEATVSRILNQEGAPARADAVTDLMGAIQPPRRIPLGEGLPPVIWIDVAPSGRLAAVLEGDESLGLYGRPGAETRELKGFEAIDLFRARTRARLLLELYDECARAERAFQWVYQGPTPVREDTILPIRRIIDSEEWRHAATADDRNLLNDAYLGKFLSLPADFAIWSRMTNYQQRDQNLRLRKNDLTNALPLLRRYLVDQRVIPA